MDTGFCLDALKTGLLYAQPEIINSDQGCQFTSEDWVDYLNEWNINISMTGKGRWHQSLNYKTPAEVYFEREREACGYVDASFGPASALRDVWTSHGQRINRALINAFYGGNL